MRTKFDIGEKVVVSPDWGLEGVTDAEVESIYLRYKVKFKDCDGDEDFAFVPEHFIESVVQK